jgi:pimeloyl-ACP methyl ester carboxylesterase
MPDVVQSATLAMQARFNTDTPAARLVTVAGSRQVECLSVGTGEPVVLSSPSWWPLDAWLLAGVPELVDSYTVIAFNHQGIGQSEATAGPYTVGSLASDLLAVMDALEVQRAHVIGFAIGAVIAMQAAITAPARVRSLVIGAAGAGESGPASGAVPPAVLQQVRSLGYRAFIREHALMEHAFGARTRTEHPQRVEALADALWRHAGTEEEFFKHALARQGHRTLDRAGSIQQPALVIVGSEDFAARGPSTPVAVAPGLAERLPNARLEVIPGVRHMLFWDQPEVVWPRVRAFLDGVAPRIKAAGRDD